MVFCLENGVRIVTTKNGKRKKTQSSLLFFKNYYFNHAESVSPSPTAKAETELLRQLKFIMGF